MRDVRSAIDGLRRSKPDIVFNLCEGVQGNPRWEMHFALALEMLGIPFTGCDPVAVGICGDKWMTKQLLRASGIATPRGFLVRTSSEIPQVEGTWIVKPSLEDAGIGIDASSVCSTHAELTARCSEVITTYSQPALVEEFIDGHELNQALFYGPKGVVVLPPGEIVFAPELPAKERVVGWKAKWSLRVRPRIARRRTARRRRSTSRCATSSPSSARAPRTVLALGGYCRFDLRQRPGGELCILDVNPNPDIGRDTGFRKALGAAGIEFADFLNQLMIAARTLRSPHEDPSRRT